jgi:DNA-binding protein H-NS
LAFQETRLTLPQIEQLEQQVVEEKKRERAKALKKVKGLCKEFGFTTGMLKDPLAEGKNKK